uniref:ditrans,polycis-polyprenyl diphosphate synthase [(2E,6E)-farnesyldiphosphate specific] n=1 Tax=Echinococcus granulosus TaxID=6210 RepID=A0A068WPH8_ECHGR|nr:nogo B receptor [Echinococcus granulosus]
MSLKVVLLRLLHSLTLILYASVTWLCAGIFDIKHVFNRYLNGGLNSTDASFLFVDKPIQNLDHIAFVIYEDDLSIPTLCQLILLSISLQIGDISVAAKSTRSHLEKLKNVDCSEIKCSSSVKGLTVYSKGRSSCVHFMDFSTGHHLVSSAAKCLSSSSLDSVTSNTIDKILYSICPIPSIELTVLFGPPSLVGLLPWHSGETEILKWPSHKSMNSSDFISLLRLYSRITKRWGRISEYSCEFSRLIFIHMYRQRSTRR